MSVELAQLVARRLPAPRTGAPPFFLPAGMPSAVALTTPVVLPGAPSFAVPGTLTVALWGPMVAAAPATVRRLRSEPSTVLMEQEIAHAVADPRQVSAQCGDVV